MTALKTLLKRVEERDAIPACKKCSSISISGRV